MAMSDTITQIRTEKGLTQEQMARDLFVTRQAISRWETGETSPSIDMVKLICVTYSIPLERFFEMQRSITVSAVRCRCPMKLCMARKQMARRANTTASGAIKRAISRQKMSIWMNSSRQQPKWKLMRWVSHAKKRFLSWPHCSRILIAGRTKPRTETEAERHSLIN